MKSDISLIYLELSGIIIIWNLNYLEILDLYYININKALL